MRLPVAVTMGLFRQADVELRRYEPTIRFEIRYGVDALPKINRNVLRAISRIEAINDVPVRIVEEPASAADLVEVRAVGRYFETRQYVTATMLNDSMTVEVEP